MEELGMCPYCRMIEKGSDEEEIKRIKILMEKGNANAFYNRAGHYA